MQSEQALHGSSWFGVAAAASAATATRSSSCFPKFAAGGRHTQGPRTASSAQKSSVGGCPAALRGHAGHLVHRLSYAGAGTGPHSATWEQDMLARLQQGKAAWRCTARITGWSCGGSSLAQLQLQVQWVELKRWARPRHPCPAAHRTQLLQQHEYMPLMQP